MLPTVAPADSSDLSDIPSFHVRCRCDNRNVDFYQLTDRQRDILQGIVEGLSNKEIGRRLGISYHTVRNHVSRLFRQFGLCSRMALRRAVCDREAKAGDARLIKQSGYGQITQHTGTCTIPKATEDRKDAALCLAIEAAIAEGIPIDITLHVRGAVISGYIIKDAAYFPELGDAFGFRVAFN